MSTPARPPHTEPAAAGFDVDADVAALSSTPKEQYEAPDPEPEAAKTEAPGADAPGGDAPPAGEGGAGDAPGGNAKDSAREFLEVYDTLQSYGFSFYSQGMPAEKFQLPKFAKDRAVHHLAKGLEKMGSPEVPWWVGLLIALAPPAGINFMAAKAYREEGERQETARQQRESRNMHVVHPTTIIHPDGSEQAAPPPPPPPPRQPAPQRPTTAVPMPPCAHCGEPVKHRKKKYCSQSCSGKARAQFYQEQKNQPQPSAA
jgi:hypothetical protein